MKKKEFNIVVSRPRQKDQQENTVEEFSKGESFFTELKHAWMKARSSGIFLMRKIFRFLDYPHASEKKRMTFENREDFLFLPEIFSAKKHIYIETVTFVLFLAFLLGGIFYITSIISGVSVLILLSFLIAMIYASQLAFKILVVYKSLSRPLISFTKEEISAISDEELPIYTILIPLYREEQVIGQVLAAMTAIDYPEDKLDVIITLEEYDHWTMDAIKQANPPAYFKTLILPDVQPKTKPKALNVAFPETKGEFLVIYDAEIVPDPDQLKKAYLAFRKYPNLASLQTRLDHYNANQNWITKLFNTEFSFYYDLFLPGLQELNFPIPLSGHSTHFRRSAIQESGAWDPYNVTEDCDLGMRLHRKGYRTDILDSYSKEEATSNLEAWIGQRTRWMKGFIQTSIVHLRHPLRFKDEIGGWKSLIAFFFTVPGTVLINALNLFSWILLILWFATHAEWIHLFFPSLILYISTFSFILGNFIFTYLNLVGAYERKRYAIVKYGLFSPVYWIMLAVATVKSTIEIVIKPHHWEKTKHGEHLS